MRTIISLIESFNKKYQIGSKVGISNRSGIRITQEILIEKAAFTSSGQILIKVETMGHVPFKRTVYFLDGFKALESKLDPNLVQSLRYVFEDEDTELLIELLSARIRKLEASLKRTQKGEKVTSEAKGEEIISNIKRHYRVMAIICDNCA